MHILVRLVVICCLPLAAASCQAQATRTHYTAESSFSDVSRAELDQMLAPIALYPDTVLSHVLIAATYPLEVVEADRWVRARPGLSPEAAVDAAEMQAWDPSVQALVAFPQLLQRMSEDLQWTQRLGDAFLLDEARVMDAIQQLRQKAYAAGSLRDLEHVTVQREERIIFIEPAVERVVYVPYYDTRVVYGNWWWDDYPPLYWHYPRGHVHVGGFYWGPRAYLGSSFFFTSFHWHQRRVVHVDYRHQHPRLYSGRSIARFDGARHWRHNPVHRRGVEYRNPRLREHYSDRRTSGHRFQDSPARRESYNRKRDASVDHYRAQEQTRHDRAAAVRQRLSNEPRTELKTSTGNAPQVQRQQVDAQRKLSAERRSAAASPASRADETTKQSRVERLEERRRPQNQAPASEVRAQEPRQRFERSEARERRQAERQPMPREQQRQSQPQQSERRFERSAAVAGERRPERVSGMATERRADRVSDRASERGQRGRRPER